MLHCIIKQAKCTVLDIILVMDFLVSILYFQVNYRYVQNVTPWPMQIICHSPLHLPLVILSPKGHISCHKTHKIWTRIPCLSFSSCLTTAGEEERQEQTSTLSLAMLIWSQLFWSWASSDPERMEQDFVLAFFGPGSSHLKFLWSPVHSDNNMYTICFQ